MNYKRIGRALMCLVLICCLMVQTVPRADATGAGLAATITGVSSVAVSAPVAVGAMAIALGVMAGTNDDFQYLVQTAASSGFEWVKDGTVELLRTVDALGNQAFYVAGEFLEDLKTRFFDLELLSSVPVYGTSIPAGTPIYVSHYKYSTWSGYITADKDCEAMFLTIGSSSYLALVFPSAPSFKNSSGGGINVGDSTSATVGSSSRVIYYFNRTTPSHNTFACPNYISSSSIAVHDFVSSIYKGKYEGYTEKVGTSYDLSLGQIPTYSLDGTVQDDAFRDYMSKQIRFQNQDNPEDPEGDESNYEWMVPLSLGAAGTVYAMTQAEQWLGSTPSDFSDYETVTDYTIVDSTMSNIGTDSNSTTVPFIIVDTTNAGGSTSPSEPSDEGETIPGAGAVTATLLEKLFGGISDKLDLTYTSIREIPELLKEFMLDVKTGFSELPSKFAEWFNNIQTSLEVLVSGQLTLGQLLGEFLSPLIDAFKSLLQSLFSPSPNFIANKVDSLVAKYPHFNVFIGLGTQLKSFFLGLGSTPPIVYIDLGAATGSYFFGGRQAFIDLSWYVDYKPTMDAILGAFIWLWLAWRIFLALPGIINGSSGAAGSIIRYSERNLKSQDGRSDK